MTGGGTTERVLRLLALLQRRPTWTAAGLAAELRVTERTVRRDAERLRSLGYPVHASPGVGGGYRLGAGTRLPPLLLDDEEAIATAVSLRLAAGGTVTGAAEAALRALSKLDQVMPPRLRERVRVLHGATDTLLGGGVEVDPDLLVTLARACRDLLRVRFGYPARDGTTRERTVEPVRLVTTGRRWYLMAHDVDRDDWRTFRLDRMHDARATTWRFRAREHPDPAQHVQHAVTTAPYRHHVRVRLHADADRVRALVPATVGQVHDEGPGRCVLEAGGDDLDWIAAHVATLGAALDAAAEVLDPPALREAAARLARRLDSLAGHSAPTRPDDGERWSVAESGPVDTSPAEDFRAVAGHFGDLVAATPPARWDDPSPVEGWTARDVVGHLIGWLPPLLEGGAGIALGPFPAVEDDPVAAWRAFSTAVQELLDDPASAGKVLSNPHTGEVPVPQAVAQFFTNDVFQHTWDLARATGQDHGLDPRRCRDLLSGMEPIEELLRGSGHYGPRVPVAEDADPATKLMAFTGRDPRWRAAAR